MLYENKIRKDNVLLTKLYGLPAEKILSFSEHLSLSNGFKLTLHIGQSGEPFASVLSYMM